VQSQIKAKIPNDWFAMAAQALADVTVITDPQKRAQAINDRDDVWKALQERLAALRKDKCWYCESNDSHSDRPIDHYRPKNAIAECEAHGGYWWLAFAWDNFRYCCTFCNSKRVDREHGTTGGKHDHFPIWTDGVRATFGNRGQDDLQLHGSSDPLSNPLCSHDNGGMRIGTRYVR
jgi:hypothetical protein